MITSAVNPKITYVRRLISDVKFRKSESRTIVESPKLITDLLKRHACIFQFILMDERFKWESDDCVDFPIIKVKNGILKSVSGLKSESGIIAVVSTTSVPFHWKNGTRIVIVDGIGNPGNLGAIIRNVAAFGWDGILTTEGTADWFNPDVIRAAAGLNWDVRHGYISCNTQDANGPIAVDGVDITSWGTWVVLDVGGQPWRDHEVALRMGVVVGSEGQGIRPWVSGLAGHKVCIPMAPHVESLNVAVATGIILASLKN